MIFTFARAAAALSAVNENSSGSAHFKKSACEMNFKFGASLPLLPLCCDTSGLALAMLPLPTATVERASNCR